MEPRAPPVEVRPPGAVEVEELPARLLPDWLLAVVVPGGQAISEGNMLGLESSGPINALGGIDVLEGFNDLGFDEDLPGGAVQLGDELFHNGHFAHGGADNDLVGAQVWNNAQGGAEGFLHFGHDVGRFAVAQEDDLHHLGLDRVGFLGTDDVHRRAGAVFHLPVVFVEQGLQGLHGGEALPFFLDGREGSGSLGDRVNPTIQAVVELDVDAGVNGQLPDGIGQRIIVEGQRVHHLVFGRGIGGGGGRIGGPGSIGAQNGHLPGDGEAGGYLRRRVGGRRGGGGGGLTRRDGWRVGLGQTDQRRRRHKGDEKNEQFYFHKGWGDLVRVRVGGFHGAEAFTFFVPWLIWFWWRCR